MRILITGAFGTAGRVVVRALEAEHELVLFDRQPFDQPATHQHGYVLSPFKTEWPVHTASLTDVASVREAMSGVDAVVHLAGHLSAPRDETIEIFRDNAYGTFVVLDAAARGGAKRVLVASSITAQIPFTFNSLRQYEPTKLPIDEEDTQPPEDAYSLSKWTVEAICSAFSRHYGLTTAALRFAWLLPDQVYRERAQRAAPASQWEGQLYAWVHAQDVAHAIVQALGAPSLPKFGAYLLAADDTFAPEPTIELIKRFRPELLDRVAGNLDGRASMVSCARAREAFDFRPAYRFPW